MMEKYRVTFDLELLDGVSPLWVQLGIEQQLESYETISNFSVELISNEEIE